MGTYSHSKLEAFRQCPRKFYFHYVAKIRLEQTPEQIATFLGSRVHETLDHLYARARDEVIVALPQLIAYFRERWKTEWTDDVMIHDKEMTGAQHRAVGERCVQDYYSRHAPFNQAKTIGLERKITFPIDDHGQHRMRGFIDRLARTPDGTWQVHDYKTNRHLPAQADKDVDPQLAYYEIGVTRSKVPAAVRPMDATAFNAFDGGQFRSRRFDPGTGVEPKGGVVQGLASVSIRR